MINGVKYFKSNLFFDERGYFSKLFSGKESDVNTFDVKEVFMTESKRGVVRGLHLQVGASANWRLITVLLGSCFDVLLDLRKDSPTYLRQVSQNLQPGSFQSVLVPPGVAHGYQSLEKSQVLYLTTSDYDPESDTGVNFKSLGINFPIEITGQSDRDLALPDLSSLI